MTVDSTPASTLLKDLLFRSILLDEDWRSLPESVREDLERVADSGTVLSELVKHRLLTDYQASRIGAGQTGGLIVGNYRILERVGAGAMGVVFRAEHLLMRRMAAIKIVPITFHAESPALTRFVTEMRAVAQLQHPNIVAAFEAGRTSPADHDFSNLYYFAMEYVPGADLEQHVSLHGPLSPAKACDVVYQIASALAEAHRKKLVHRDIKPSNILITAEGQAKLTDFGLARRFHQAQLTQPGTTLGTVDYMAPEQARDASSVDIRADIYSLGATLFWALTGSVPFSSSEGLAQALLTRQKAPPPSVRAVRSAISEDLDALIRRAMALRPEDRFSDPQSFMEALLQFLKSNALVMSKIDDGVSAELKARRSKPDEDASPRILIVDDDPSARAFIRLALQEDEYDCSEAGNGAVALAAFREQEFDLILLDVEMPVLSGPETLRHIRDEFPGSNVKVIMTSGAIIPDQLAQLLTVGADDFVAKPASIAQLRSRAKGALRLKKAQDRSDRLTAKLRSLNAALAHDMTCNADRLADTRNHLLVAMAELGVIRCGHADGHLTRMQRYCRSLAEKAAELPSLAEFFDAGFIGLLEHCAPLHDIGHVALPDHLLQNPGKLNRDEHMLIQTHTINGAQVLEKVMQRSPENLEFLRVAIDVVRHHHEHFDGNGYPDRLIGNAIPLSARLVSIADVYDALRSRRVHRPALSHTLAVEIITSTNGQFDPNLLEAFKECAGDFERIFHEMP